MGEFVTVALFFYQMQAAKINPNVIKYTGLLKARRVKEAQAIFHSLIPPTEQL